MAYMEHTLWERPWLSHVTVSCSRVPPRAQYVVHESLLERTRKKRFEKCVKNAPVRRGGLATAESTENPPERGFEYDFGLAV